MSIPKVLCTGYEDVDGHLGLMLKWQNNGSMQMAYGHAYNACYEMLAQIAEGTAGDQQAAVLVKFLDDWLGRRDTTPETMT